MNVKRVGYFAGHRAGITSLAAGWGSKNNLLISGSEDKTSRLWDMRTKKAVHGIVGFEQEITAVEFVGDDSFAVACGNTIYVYDQRYIGIVHQAQKSNTNIFSNRSSGSSDIQSISTRGDFIAFVDEDGRLEVVDVTDAGLSTSADGRFSKEIHDTVAACVCFHPELLLLATGGFDSQVRIWDIASEKIIRQAAVGMVDSAQMSDSTPDASSANRVRMVNPPFIYALAFAPGLASSDGEAADVEHEAWTAVSGHADGRIMHTSAENSVYWPDCHNYSISAM
ncbi:WD40-repeat-containing domain protein [Coemansia spiralis]|nr:WD40-repeat-containing domain protein [Coemansia spiralis]